LNTASLAGKASHATTSILKARRRAYEIPIGWSEYGLEKDPECTASVSTSVVKERKRHTKSFCSLTFIAVQYASPTTNRREETPRLNLGRIVSPQDLRGEEIGDTPRMLHQKSSCVSKMGRSSIGAFMPAEDRMLEDIALRTQAQRSPMCFPFPHPSASRVFRPAGTKGVRGTGT
jgi:hypothetical protein